MTKNERAFAVWLFTTPLRWLLAAAQQFKATDYATFLTHVIAAIEGVTAHPLTEESEPHA